MNQVKSGFLSSEFVMSAVSILASMAVSVLGHLPQELAKLNPLAGSLAALVVPAVTGWIAARYVKARTDLKVAAIQAGKAADPTTELNR